MQPKKYSGAWNFGPGDNDNISVENVARKFIHHLVLAKLS